MQSESKRVFSVRVLWLQNVQIFHFRRFNCCCLLLLFNNYWLFYLHYSITFDANREKSPKQANWYWSSCAIWLTPVDVAFLIRTFTWLLLFFTIFDFYTFMQFVFILLFNVRKPPKCISSVFSFQCLAHTTYFLHIPTIQI